jgi:hypothetical protein
LGIDSNGGPPVTWDIIINESGREREKKRREITSLEKSDMEKREDAFVISIIVRRIKAGFVELSMIPWQTSFIVKVEYVETALLPAWVKSLIMMMRMVIMIEKKRGKIDTSVSGFILCDEIVMRTTAVDENLDNGLASRADHRGRGGRGGGGQSDLENVFSSIVEMPPRHRTFLWYSRRNLKEYKKDLNKRMGRRKEKGFYIEFDAVAKQWWRQRPLQKMTKNDFAFFLFDYKENKKKKERKKEKKMDTWCRWKSWRLSEASRSWSSTSSTEWTSLKNYSNEGMRERQTERQTEREKDRERERECWILCHHSWSCPVLPTLLFIE